jgi:hypothetical protein
MMEQAQALRDAQAEALGFALNVAADLPLTNAQEDDAEETDMEHDVPERSKTAVRRLKNPALQEARDEAVTLAMKAGDFLSAAIHPPEDKDCGLVAIAEKDNYSETEDNNIKKQSETGMLDLADTDASRATREEQEGTVLSSESEHKQDSHQSTGHRREKGTPNKLTPGAVRIPGANATSDEDDQSTLWISTELDPELVQAELAPDLDEVIARGVQISLRKAVQATVVTEKVEIEVRLCGLSRNFCYLLLSAGILVVAVGVVVGGVLGANNSSPIISGTTVSPVILSENMNTTNTLAPTVYTAAAPTASPASPAIFSEKMKKMLDLIGPTVTSNTEFLQDPKTPQYAALEWLADIDEWNTDIDIDSLPLQVWVERYVLAVLYLSTKGNSWSTAFNFLQNTSVCEWSNMKWEEGVICDGLYVKALCLSKLLRI